MNFKGKERKGGKQQRPRIEGGIMLPARTFEEGSIGGDQIMGCPPGKSGG